jgi:hypothetical protein
MDVVLAVWSEVIGSDYIRSVNVDAWREWADAQILRLDDPPGWLCDLSLALTAEQVQTAIDQSWAELGWRGSEDPFQNLDRTGLSLGLLFLRFLRGDLDLAALLRRAAERVDASNYRIDCSTFCMLFNEMEGRGSVFPSSRPLADRVTELFAPFTEYAREQLRVLPAGHSEPGAVANRPPD